MKIPDSGTTMEDGPNSAVSPHNGLGPMSSNQAGLGLSSSTPNVNSGSSNKTGGGDPDGGGNNANGGGGNPQRSPQSYSIPGILHFIQHEWARFEMERSQWDVERAELQVTTLTLTDLFPVFQGSPFHPQSRFHGLQLVCRRATVRLAIGGKCHHL